MPQNSVKYLVDHNREIQIVFPVEGENSGLVVNVSHPDWNPGAQVVVTDEVMDSILEGLFNYTQTGQAPILGSEIPRERSHGIFGTPNQES